MNRYFRRQRVLSPFCCRVLLVVGFTALVSACSTLRAPPWSYQRPPVVGDRVPASADAVACKSEQSALAMALTGFYMEGCRDLKTITAYRVINLEFRDLGKGQTVWLVRVVAGEELRWIPIPWHNWA